MPPQSNQRWSFSLQFTYTLSLSSNHGEHRDSLVVCRGFTCVKARTSSLCSSPRKMSGLQVSNKHTWNEIKTPESLKNIFNKTQLLPKPPTTHRGVTSEGGWSPHMRGGKLGTKVQVWASRATSHVLTATCVWAGPSSWGPLKAGSPAELPGGTQSPQWRFHPLVFSGFPFWIHEASEKVLSLGENQDVLMLSNNC